MTGTGSHSGEGGPLFSSMAILSNSPYTFLTANLLSSSTVTVVLLDDYVVVSIRLNDPFIIDRPCSRLTTSWGASCFSTGLRVSSMSLIQNPQIIVGDLFSTILKSHSGIPPARATECGH